METSRVQDKICNKSLLEELEAAKQKQNWSNLHISLIFYLQFKCLNENSLQQTS